MERIKFGTDGVRGTAGAWPINIEGTRKIAFGLGRYLQKMGKKNSIAIGRDTRTSGDLLTVVMSEGLIAAGIDVYDIGVMTTAGVAYLTRKHGLDLGVIISASHNPWTQNGIKVMSAKGLKLTEEVEKAIEAAINTEELLPVNYENTGFLHQVKEWSEEYIDYLVEAFTTAPMDRLKVALDCSQGAASHVGPACFERLGIETMTFAASPTGKNINVDSGSEVAREGTGNMVEAVRTGGYHAGIAFDGDADRVIFVDEKGELVDGDHILYIVGTTLHKKGELPGPAVVTTEMANTGLDEALEKVGIKTVRTKVGDKYVVREIQKEGYVLGGEQSGHIILYDEEHTTGDGIYTALYLCSILANQPETTLQQMASGLVKKPQVIVSAHVGEKPDLATLETFLQVRGETCDHFGDRATINIRYSGTEPLVRVMIEADASYSLEDVTYQAVRLCRAVQTDVGSPGEKIEAKDATSGSKLAIPDL